MTMHVSTSHLPVSGGRLYYEVRGHGPLLLVVGQPMTSEPFGPTADMLADSYTVVTYDPRGLGRSAVDDPTLDVTPDVEGADLAAIIDAIGKGPADVFGTSGGAVAGLALVANHPGRVRTLIAHEPPLTEYLPDAAAIRAAIDDTENAYRGAGSGAAWGKFISLVMHSGPVPDTGVPPVPWPPRGDRDAAPEPADGNADGDDHHQPSERQRANDDLFFLHMLKPFTRYRPPLDTLRSTTARVVLAVGESSGEEIAGRSTRALADRLGSAPVTFPGDHGGFMADPVAFAAAIQRTLTPSRTGSAGTAGLN
jgi:pimeloyl-ACP methyl ester carboxylesterase